MNEKTLWYIADPMCSWCWGFSPVIEAIRREYGAPLKVELLLGGLRPGTKDPMPSTQREEILRHWHAVQRRTGQPFKFEGAMPTGFIYNTEPASRGVVAASIIDSHTVFPFFKAVQSAFYVEQQDVTTAVVLTRLAADVGLNAGYFSRVFESDTAKHQTLDHFQKVRQWGVHGFPTTIMQDATSYSVLTNGYCPFEELRPKLDEWLKR
ncbi:DsbA family protein [Nitrosospira sp. NpAV]|uniref:DsbA family protein n=1 Tax=Nitrosospira sp. NpAV TaxID=58133 RepID=UPI0005A2F82B|nr:DsbA family protein [Nitrosospira sp. NpAV]KIO49210.1 protein-disulfide isomerase [Nitrosospira sp. NpAV]